LTFLSTFHALYSLPGQSFTNHLPTVEMKISKLRNNKTEAGARDKFPILMKILLN
jgi:hypothetical protein